MTNELAPYIGEPHTILVEVKVLGSRTKPSSADMEVVTVSLKVVEALQGEGPKPGAIFEISGARYTNPVYRIRSRRDAWNNLKFNFGDSLIMAIQAAPGGRWNAVAGAEITPANGLRAGVHESLRIEAAPPDQRLALLPHALLSDGVLQQYALLTLDKPTVGNRERGAVALADAFVNAQSEIIRAPVLASMMGRRYFQDEHGPDTANKTIIAAVLKVLLSGIDGKPRERLLSALATTIGARLDPDDNKDRQLRAAFVAAIADPPKRAVAHMFTEAAAADPEDERLKRLADAWSH